MTRYALLLLLPTLVVGCSESANDEETQGLIVELRQATEANAWAIETARFESQKQHKRADRLAKQLTELKAQRLDSHRLAEIERTLMLLETDVCFAMLDKTEQETVLALWQRIADGDDTVERDRREEALAEGFASVLRSLAWDPRIGGDGPRARYRKFMDADPRTSSTAPDDDSIEAVPPSRPDIKPTP